MSSLSFTFTTTMWMWHGKGAWHFVTLPKDTADKIRFFNASAKGFTPISVNVRINDTQWKTSIFPDSKSGSYLLAIKAAVRKSENLTAGNDVTLQLQVHSDI